MRTLIFSLQADDWFSEHNLSFRERDNLIEQLHASLVYISRTSQTNFQLFPLNIDCLHLILELEINSTTILVVEIRSFGECP